MPIYYFHLRQRDLMIEDDEGVTLPDVADARRRALSEAGELASADVKNGRLCLACSIEVADDAGRIVCSVPFGHAVQVRS